MSVAIGTYLSLLELLRSVKVRGGNVNDCPAEPRGGLLEA